MPIQDEEQPQADRAQVHTPFVLVRIRNFEAFSYHGPVYSTVTLLPLTDALVRTSPFCSMLMIVAPERDVPPALAPVKVTDPKSANGTMPEPLVPLDDTSMI